MCMQLSQQCIHNLLHACSMMVGMISTKHDGVIGSGDVVLPTSYTVCYLVSPLCIVVQYQCHWQCGASLPTSYTVCCLVSPLCIVVVQYQCRSIIHHYIYYIIQWYAQYYVCCVCNDILSSTLYLYCIVMNTIRSYSLTCQIINMIT